MPTYDQMLNKDVYDRNGDKVGKLDSFYVNEVSDSPDWIAVKTGLFGGNINFVPLESAEPTDEGLRINFTKDQVKDAPNVEADGEIGPEEEGELYNYYNQVDSLGSEADGSTEDNESTSNPGDGSMPRSVEEVQFDKRQVETGRVRLKKYIVTENVNFTVPLRKEKIRVEREPITEKNLGDAYQGSELTEAEHEEVIHEEQLTVDKKVVPKERISLEKDVIQDEEHVNENVRKEQVDVQGDDR